MDGALQACFSLHLLQHTHVAAKNPDRLPWGPGESQTGRRQRLEALQLPPPSTTTIETSPPVGSTAVGLASPEWELEPPHGWKRWEGEAVVPGAHSWAAMNEQQQRYLQLVTLGG